MNYSFQKYILVIILVIFITYLFSTNKKENFIIQSRKYMLPDDPYVIMKNTRFLVTGNGPYHFINYNKYNLPHWYASTAYFDKVSPYLDYSAYIY